MRTCNDKVLVYRLGNLQQSLSEVKPEYLANTRVDLVEYQLKKTNQLHSWIWKQCDDVIQTLFGLFGHITRLTNLWVQPLVERTMIILWFPVKQIHFVGKSCIFKGLINKYMKSSKIIEMKTKSTSLHKTMISNVIHYTSRSPGRCVQAPPRLCNDFLYGPSPEHTEPS